MSTNATSDVGGAAAHAGVDFQHRLAAWFATAMLSRFDVSPTLAVAIPLYVERLSMETADSVDDLVMTCEGGVRLFVQAKTSPFLSSDLGSDFAKAIRQFVLQHRASPETKDVYLFAVAPTASGKIRQQLRKLLQAVRYDPTSWSTAPLSEIEKEVLQAFRTLVGEFSKSDQGIAWTQEQVIAFARKLYIVSFDLDDSGSDSRTAYVLLFTVANTASPPDLVWSRLIHLCLDASRKRLQISAGGLRATLSRFIDETAKDADQLARYKLVQTGTVSAK